MDGRKFVFLTVLALASSQRNVRRLSTTRSVSTASSLKKATTFVINRQAYGKYSTEIPKRDQFFGKSSYQFEGVDYDLMPPAMHDHHHDCYARFIDCLRSVPIIGPICAFYYNDKYFYNFPSTCDIELHNCIYRKLHGYGAGQYWYKTGSNVYYYNGEGKPCEWYGYSNWDLPREKNRYFGDFAKYSQGR